MCTRGTSPGLGTARKNAPSFIYEILHGEAKQLSGRTEHHRQKMWKNIAVDQHIPTEALDGLDKIEEIELRSSCEGSGPERPTFLIVRFRSEEDLQKIADFVQGMNAFEDIRCGAERGNMGIYRIGITAPLWYEKDKRAFEKWWLELPVKIQVVLAVIESLSE
ncbi:MAG: hypothetical protein JRJ12_00235 [Deltaproteobacteria bacterium]|nr:hypothetical protein [Deltaproteobacteria bacterium]MBW2069792.1 hypothetical protein [Deltaproteobacteria bacterium]